MKHSQAIVGVRELRARLSAYLRAVSQGKSVTIGNRQRRPVARLVPVRRSVDDGILDQLAERGVIQRGAGKPGRAERVTPRTSKRSVSDIVIEDRG